jgi:diguanylate cyclase (GGDEF)-like protein
VRIRLPRRPAVPAGLAIAPWVVAALGLLSTFVLPGPADGQAIRAALVVTLGAFFTVLITRLVMTALREPQRRVGLLLLAVGVALWAAGSATVSAGQTTASVAFPSPGEVLYLASYLGVAAFVMLDVPRHRLPTTVVWLEAVVVCSGGACLAAFVVVTPLASAVQGDDVHVLIALLYPMLDVLLAVVVAGQLMLGLRAPSGRTGALMVGFLGLAVADSSLVADLADGVYSSSVLLDCLWGASFGVVVCAAVCHGNVARNPIPRARRQTALLLVAAAVALAVLVLAPQGAIKAYVTVPAVIALLSTGARMAVALREAQGAAEALRLSLTDELTGLPNRRALLAAADAALAQGGPLSLLLMDLDGFKDINDSLGHQVGDGVLVALADRMRGALAADVLVARLGGDEFAILAPSNDEVGLLELAQVARAAVSKPMRIATIDLAVDSSIGITLCERADTSTELLRRADIAMYEAKESGGGTLLFDTSQDGFSHQRLRRGEELRSAISERQFVVWYQPQVDARSGQVVALEALVRWQHPTEGLLIPVAFLPDARRAGLMLPLSEIVTRRVVEDLRLWRDAGLRLRVAINWAPPELLGGQLLPRLLDALAVAGMPGGSVLLEVTEDSFVSDPEHARQVLSDLRGHGIQAAIDDYGTGFSSLAYLRDLAVDELKIDRSFVSTLVRDQRSAMIVQTTTQMAHALGMRVVAEGVEDERTQDALVTAGVDVLKGYHIARPMPVDQVADWVEQWSINQQATLRTVPEARSA